MNVHIIARRSGVGVPRGVPGQTNMFEIETDDVRMMFPLSNEDIGEGLKAPRTNFPETWLWDIVLVGYVFHVIIYYRNRL